jgi:hypothetical protein
MPMLSWTMRWMRPPVQLGRGPQRHPRLEEQLGSAVPVAHRDRLGERLHVRVRRDVIDAARTGGDHHQRPGPPRPLNGEVDRQPAAGRHANQRHTVDLQRVQQPLEQVVGHVRLVGEGRGARAGQVDADRAVGLREPLQVPVPHAAVRPARVQQ